MRITLLSAAFLATGVAFASTPVDGWYTSVFGGYTYLPDNINTSNINGLINGTSWKGGYNVGGRIGYQSNPIRYEGEFTYLHANSNYYNVNNVQQQTGSVGDSIGNLVMANIYYDTPEILPSVTSFLGVGLGYGFLETTLSGIGPKAITFFKANESVFAYQGTVGLTYNFTENYTLNMAYRYVATTEGSNYGKVFQAHMVSGGAIYHFDYGNYK